MFKLVILTKEVVAERAAENASSMLPDAAIAFNAVCISEGTGAGVGTETLPPMAHPGFTVITYGSHHAHSSAVNARMLYDTVRGLHAFCFTTLGTHREFLH